MIRIDLSHHRVVPLLALLAAASAVSAPAARNGAQTYGAGTLQYFQRVYYPQGCVHNGNHAVCSFTFVNQGQPLTVNAGIPGSELTGISFVDNGHVPHGADAAYFIDPFGSQRNQLFLNKNDTGLMTVEFKDVDPAVTSGEFHLRDQIIGRIAVAQPGTGAPAVGAQAAGVQVAGTAPQVPMQQLQPQAAPSCVPGTSACNAQAKVTAAQANVAGWAGLVNSFKGMVPGAPAPVQQAAPAPQPQAQVLQPQAQAVQPQAPQPQAQMPGLTPQQQQALQRQQAGQQPNQ
jgi:hypothetical protein